MLKYLLLFFISFEAFADSYLLSILDFKGSLSSIYLKQVEVITHQDANKICEAAKKSIIESNYQFTTATCTKLIESKSAIDKIQDTLK